MRGLWDGATHREERYAAIALAGHRAYRGWQDPGALPLYAHLVTTGAWWDLVDQVAADRVGAILLHHRDEVGPLMREWARADDLWLRRSAILSQLTFKEQTDTQLLRRLHRAESRGPVVLDPQGHRVGAAPACAHRPGLGPPGGGGLRRPALRPVEARGPQTPLSCADVVVPEP